MNNMDIVHDVFTSPDIFPEHIVRHLNPIDIYNMRIVDKTLNKYIPYKLFIQTTRERVIEKLYSIINEDYVKSFIRYLNKYDCWLSGSFVLSCITGDFFTNCPYGAQDIDVFTLCNYKFTPSYKYSSDEEEYSDDEYSSDEEEYRGAYEGSNAFRIEMYDSDAITESPIQFIHLRFDKEDKGYGDVFEYAEEELDDYYRLPQICSSKTIIVDYHERRFIDRLIPSYQTIVKKICDVEERKYRIKYGCDRKAEYNNPMNYTMKTFDITALANVIGFGKYENINFIYDPESISQKRIVLLHPNRMNGLFNRIGKYENRGFTYSIENDDRMMRLARYIRPPVVKFQGLSSLNRFVYKIIDIEPVQFEYLELLSDCVRRGMIDGLISEHLREYKKDALQPYFELYSKDKEIHIFLPHYKISSRKITEFEELFNPRNLSYINFHIGIGTFLLEE